MVRFGDPFECPGIYNAIKQRPFKLVKSLKFFCSNEHLARMQAVLNYWFRPLKDIAK